jgi:hypothetical protein
MEAPVSVSRIADGGAIFVCVLLSFCPIGFGFLGLGWRELGVSREDEGLGSGRNGKLENNRGAEVYMRRAPFINDGVGGVRTIDVTERIPGIVVWPPG